MSLAIPPQTIEELMLRVQQIAGKTLGQLATELGVAVPENLLKHKGWIGQLLEAYLGADAGSHAEPDFTLISVEMKTLPLNHHRQPKESTYVCTVTMNDSDLLQWEHSWVKRKLNQVLWVPIEAEQAIPIAERFIGNGWIWRPTKEQEAVLKQDWEELMDRFIAGEQADISACEGEYLQIRPKAANSQVLVSSCDEEGNAQQMNPKGFYLRTRFTRELLAKNSQ